MTTSDNSALVSIIIPAYNRGKYIHRAIESSLRQTYTNIEIIIIDDGSKDNTFEIAKIYEAKDKRVKVFHQDNAGVSAARNYGIREAQGDYITFLDSDDWLEDNAVKFLLDKQLQYSDKLIIASNREVFMRGDGTMYYYQRRDEESRQQIFSNIEETLQNWRNLHLASSCYKIFQMSIIRSHNLKFKEGINNHEDGLFVFEYLHYVNGVYYENQQIYTALKHFQNSTFSMNTRKLIESLTEADKIMMAYPGNTPIIMEYLKIMHVGSICHFSRRAIETGASKDEIKYIRDDLRKYFDFAIHSPQVSIKTKISLYVILYMPSFVGQYCITPLWSFLKMIRDLFMKKVEVSGQ
ncbi:MAG: glycosyltransferase family 2 protein [Synergistaceae bacterium]|nr:glycosyltransferase family 2 protein [Synergistaceae bacterium]